jgi:hypothetical protein
MDLKSIKYKTRILEHYGIISFSGISIKYFGMRMVSNRRRIRVMYRYIENELWDLVRDQGSK